MKLTEIEQFWPILEAIRAGKTIQINTIDGYWEDIVDYVVFSKSLDKYRIKQEEKVMYACQYKSNITQKLYFSVLRDSLEEVKKEWKYCQGATVYGFYKFTAVDSKVIKMEIVE